MKVLIIAAVMTTILCTNVYSQDHLEKTNDWIDNYDLAQKKATKDKKPLLIFFTGSDWCGNCKRLIKHFFNTEKFKNTTNGSFVLYEADFPSNKDLITKEQAKVNEVLFKIFNQSGGFPTIVVLDSDGEELGTIAGLNVKNDPKSHFELLNKALEN